MAHRTRRDYKFKYNSDDNQMEQRGKKTKKIRNNTLFLWIRDHLKPVKETAPGSAETVCLTVCMSGLVLHEMKPLGMDSFIQQ